MDSNDTTNNGSTNTRNLIHINDDTVTTVTMISLIMCKTRMMQIH